MTTKTLYLLTSISLFFAGGFLTSEPTTSYSLILVGCLGLILYTLED